jgi:hypothetical protein
MNPHLPHTPSKVGLVKETQFTYELLHFGYVGQWESFRGALTSRQLFLHEDTSLPKQLFVFPRFIAIDSGHLWMSIKCYKIVFFFFTTYTG